MTEEKFSAEYMAHLNDQQRAAVRTADGATLLLAVPGSGKTTVLVTRLGYMIYCRGIDPKKILTMTYTVAATKEMRQRFCAMFGDEYAGSLDFRTINSLSAKIIDFYSRNYSSRPPFSLLENDGQAAGIISRIYQSVNGDYPTDSTVKDIRTAITYIKNMMLGDEEIKELDTEVQNLPKIYSQYCKALRSNGLMDFDDQMAYALTILKTHPPVLDYFRERYRYICVDEAQDTSKIQHAIIGLLAQGHGNLFMVGDEDQSIYGFRAAYPEALLGFENDYPNAKVLLIEQNYRSTGQIVRAADRFVSRNKFRHEKSMMPTRNEGVPVQTVTVADRRAQYRYLFCKAQGCTQETAVLYRNNESALPLIDLFERNGVAYNCRQFDGSFFTHKSVVDVTDIINFAYDRTDTDLFRRIYYKFGIYLSKNDAELACRECEQSGRPIIDILLHSSTLSNSVKNDLFDLQARLSTLQKTKGADVIDYICCAIGYARYLESKKADDGKLKTLSLISEFAESPKELLQRLSELRTITQSHENSPDNRFTLSTIHSSKGLEYNRVFMLDVFDGILPSADEREDEKLYEEERRIYYVGITRAKDELNLFRCENAVSSFNSQVLSGLPHEVFEPDSAVGIVKQNLVGKKYTHRENGKGVIIAQDGEAVTAEFEGGAVMNLTLSEMLEQREIKLEYSQPKPRPNLAQRIKSTVVNELEYREMMSKAAVGARVEHDKFGSGTITKLDKRIVSVFFDKLGETKKFDLPTSVRQGLIKV